LRRAAGGAAWALLTGLVLAACGPPPADDPLSARLGQATTDPAAARAVTAMFSAYGGYDTWLAKSTAQYRYTLSFHGGEPAPRRVTRERHSLSLRDGVTLSIQEIDTPEARTIAIDGDSVQVTAGGRPVTDPAEIEFRHAYGRIVRWDFLTPWVLVDPGSRLTSRGVRTPASGGTVPPGPCDVVRLRFAEAGEGGGTDDWYDIYISRLSHLVEQVHSYRSGPNEFRLAVWSNHLDFDGLLVATRRETYASDTAGAAGRLEAVAELAEVRFDAPAGRPPR
jgi:hypothetical protein